MGLIQTLVVSLIHFYKWIELFFIKCVLKFNPNYVNHYFPDNVKINGDKPWDMKVHNPKEFFPRVGNSGLLGLGETYMEGLWDCDDLAEFFTRCGRANSHKPYFNPVNRFLNWLELYFFNNQTKAKSVEVGEQHYDIGNNLYERMLDKYMNYTCGYWRTAKDLEQAQIDKMCLIAGKLQLQPGMKILDLGCGFGGLSKFLAENYGVSCTGVTISKEQARYGQEMSKGLPVEIKFMDYRNFPKNEKFDRIISIGMLEHVGQNNYAEFFSTARGLLKDDGILLVHCIGVAHHDIPRAERWLCTYIFPNAILPYYKQITEHIEKKFIIEDWQNMGWDYSKTLEAWYENFEKSWPEIGDKYGERFYRMWKYYLLTCCGLFRARKLQLWQVVLTKDGVQGGYYAAR